MTHLRAKLLVAAIVLTGAVGYLTYAGVRAGKSYYLAVDDFLAAPDLASQRVRLHGKVAAEDFHAEPAARTASFRLLGQTGQIPLTFRGTIPDLLRAGSDVMVEGRLDAAGLFQADVLLTKCASKYDMRSGRRVTTASLGEYCLAAAALGSGMSVLASLAAVRSGSAGAARAGRWALHAVTVAVTLAGAILMRALVSDEFRLAYVTRFSEQALPLAYKISAFWAGQEGSILLWAWMVAVSASLAIARGGRRNSDNADAIETAVLAVVCGFFAAMMLFACNPFRLLPGTPVDGEGMNPMLQDPAMVFHPPALFVGYAALAVPFAILLGGVVAGRLDFDLLGRMRRWSLAAWVFLTAGVVLGAKWAYVELGWGGYWAWDPVENASLLPWFTTTGMIHSLIVQQKRGMFKLSNAILAAMSFLLCVFGSYLTRSGVISSVHAFPKSAVGWFFLGFLAVGTLASIAIIVLRRQVLRGDRPLQRLISREGVILGANVLLVIMMAVTLVGTIYPLISSLYSSTPVTLGVPFYNKVVLPLALALLGLMGLGPILTYGGAGARPWAGLVLPLASAASAAGAGWYWSGGNLWVVACAGVVVLTVVGAVQESVRSVSAGIRNRGGASVSAVLGSLRANLRTFIALSVHVGMVLIAIGVAGSGLFPLKQDCVLTPGQSVRVGRYQVKLDSLEEVRKANYQAVVANVVLSDSTGLRETLTPQRRFYDKSPGQSNSEVAIHSRLREDVYLSLGGWQGGGKQVTIEVLVNPLVAWIWIGGLVLLHGGMVCTLGRTGRGRQRPGQEEVTTET